MVANKTESSGLPPIVPLLALVVLGTLVLNRPSAPPVPMPAPPSAANLPILDDPEAAEEYWHDYVWADSREQAIRRCQNMASAWQGTTLIGTVQVGKKRWQCNFKAETAIEYYESTPSQ